MWARNRFLSNCFFLVPNVQDIRRTYHWNFISLLKLSQSANPIYYPNPPETFSAAQRMTFENHLWCSSSQKLPSIYTCKMPTYKNVIGWPQTFGPKMPKARFYSRTYHSSNRKCNDWIQPTISTIKSGIPHRSGPFRMRMFMNIQSLNWPKIKLRLIFDFISNAVIGWWTSPKWKCFGITFWFLRK